MIQLLTHMLNSWLRKGIHFFKKQFQHAFGLTKAKHRDIQFKIVGLWRFNRSNEWNKIGHKLLSTETK